MKFRIMKKMLAVCLLLLSNNSFSQWRATTPVPIIMRDITFTDEYTGYALARFGNFVTCASTFALYKTVDGGENWVKMKTDVETDAKRSFHFVNSMVGWIAEEGSEVLKTTDGGVTWTSQTSGVAPTLNDIWFRDLNNGFLVGPNGMIQRTTNGGSTWSTMSSVTSATLTRIYFYSNTLGFIAASNGQILRTTNGGSSWTPINTGLTTLYDISFTSTQNGYAVGTIGSDRYLCTTVNGGLSWTTSLLGPGSGATRVFFTSPQTGYIKLTHSSIIKTTDGGATWNPTAATTNGTEENWQEMFFIDDNTGFLCGDDGRITKTKNGGLSWENKNTGIYDDILSVSAPHKDTAYCGDNQGRIFKTHNAGVTWYQQVPDIATSINKLYFHNPTVGFAAGPNGVLLKTIDAGFTWDPKLLNSTYNITDLSFPTEQIGYASAENGIVYKTIDAGETWDSISTGFNYALLDIYFTTPDTGYVTSSDRILSTFNGGSTWVEYDPTPVGIIRDIVFPSVNVGYCVLSSRIIRTEDAGGTWEIADGIPSGVYEMWFADDSSGYMTYSIGQRRTIDSCTTLLSQSTACGTIGSMYTIDMVDGGTYGYAGGGAGGSADGRIHQLGVPEIVATQISTSGYCPGNNIFVAFYGRGFFANGNIFTAELSDASGSFASPTVIGTYSNLDPFFVYQSGVITATIPGGTPPGSGYRIRVVASNPGYIGPDNGFDITIQSGQAPSINLSSPIAGTICSGLMMELNTTVTAGGMNPSYAWTLNGNPYPANGASLFIDSLVNGDQIQVTMTSNLGCASPTTALSNVFTAAVSDSIDIGLTADTSFCATGTLQLNANPGMTYDWSPSTGLSSTTVADPIAIVDQNITYSVLVTNAAGCTDSDSVTIELLPESSILTNDTAACLNTTLQLEATPGGTYSWTPSINLSNPSISNPVATILEDEVYYVNITSAEGCQYFDSILITANPLPEILLGDTLVCVNSTIQLDATSGGSYNWSPGTGLNNTTIQNPQATVTSGITYYLNVTSAEGCVTTDSIAIDTYTEPIVTGLADTSICEGECIVLSPALNTGIQSALWSTSTGLNDSTLVSPTACPTVTATYSVLLTDINTCTVSDTTTIIVNSLPLVPTISFNGTALESSPGNQYQWYLDGMAISGANSMTYTPTGNGNYTVEITNAEGCTEVSDVFALVTWGIEEMSQEASIVLYPNPVNDLFFLEFKGEHGSDALVTVSDLKGKLLMQKTFSVNSDDYTLEVNPGTLATGVYFCKIVTAYNQYFVQFVVE